MADNTSAGGGGPSVGEALPPEGALREGILEISPVPIAILDADRQVVLANDRAKRELGLREEELLGLSTDDSSLSAVDADGDPVGEGEGITAEILETGEPVQNRVYRIDLPTGEHIWLSISGTPLLDDDGAVEHIVLAFENITERKERERRFDAVFNNTYQFTGLMEPDGTLIEANRTALQFVGAEREAAVGKHLAESPWITDGNRERVYDATERARGGEFVRFEMEIHSAEREGTVPIDFSLKPFTDEHGEVVLLIPEGRDITELKQREADLREERAFTDSMLGAVPDIFYAYDADGNFVRWNDRFASVTGYDDDEIETMEPLDFVPADESESVGEAIGSILETGEPVVIESYLETRAGDRIPYEFKAGQWRGPEGEVMGVVGIGRDVTERKERERRFEAIFNQTYQFTGLMEPDGTMLEANDTALSFAGIERDDVVGKHLVDAAWITEENRDQVREATERARGGEFVRFEMEIDGAEPGETVPIDFSLKPVTDESGEVVLLIPEGRDITELKQREQELAEKTDELERTVDRLERTNAELEQFAYVASHDLQEPLRMISSYLDLLELEYEDALDEAAHEYIEYAVDGADRMREMIDDLLAFSRVQTREEEFEPRSVEAVLEEARDNLAVAISESDATISHDDLPTLAVDDHQLRQLFQNLLDNAISYAGDEPPRVHVAATEHDDRWEFAVEDEGVGIPEAEQDRIFDIFMRGAGTEDGGSGIGLAICKRVVENHGGRIWVESDPGEGTTVRFTLAKRPGGNGGVPR
ncbi:PAS domain-containing sensor histidine kinase [Haloglomus salinum]|uniref:PAS domain-containing sensor histidine kinase n=1 Tax=Haloglomus salinum TaxID=2962673 RepID=UPI0020C9BEE7|nr:PAS domain S-box protein [Haloglomus salinum]